MTSQNLININMTSNFDDYIEELLTEALRCDGPSLRQLSDKPNYRFMACKANPYSPGFKRIYWGRKGKKVNLNHCKTAVPGQARYEECRDVLRAIIKRRRKMRLLQKLKKLRHKGK
jgi:hypothetical protein